MVDSTKLNLVHLINGPNLNLLGERNPELYGTETLSSVVDKLTDKAAKAGFKLVGFQSNSEGALIDQIQAIRHQSGGLIINPGAYSHSSIAMRDALECYSAPIIEVHLSNIYRRESFRQHSYVTAVATAAICGMGAAGYYLALDYLLAH